MNQDFSWRNIAPVIGTILIFLLMVAAMLYIPIPEGSEQSVEETDVEQSKAPQAKSSATSKKQKALIRQLQQASEATALRDAKNRAALEGRLKYVENEQERLLSPDDEWRDRIDEEMREYGTVPEDVVNQEQFDARVRQWLDNQRGNKEDIVDPDAYLHKDVDALEDEAKEIRKQLDD